MVSRKKPADFGGNPKLCKFMSAERDWTHPAVIERSEYNRENRVCD